MCQSACRYVQRSGLLSLRDIGISKDARHAREGEARATVDFTATAPGCADSDLGSGELWVTWAVDRDGSTITTRCEPFSIL